MLLFYFVIITSFEQHCDTTLKHKSEMVTKLEEKTNHLVSVLKDNEKK